MPKKSKSKKITKKRVSVNTNNNNIHINVQTAVKRTKRQSNPNTTQKKIPINMTPQVIYRVEKAPETSELQNEVVKLKDNQNKLFSYVKEPLLLGGPLTDNLDDRVQGLMENFYRSKLLPSTSTSSSSHLPLASGNTKQTTTNNTNQVRRVRTATYTAAEKEERRLLKAEETKRLKTEEKERIKEEKQRLKDEEIARKEAVKKSKREQEELAGAGIRAARAARKANKANSVTNLISSVSIPTLNPVQSPIPTLQDIYDSVDDSTQEDIAHRKKYLKALYNEKKVQEEGYQAYKARDRSVKI